MDKRFQVFVSSTFEDLREERAEVIQALLELDCMPAGMELFPASTEQQWNWIKKVIDESDYYMVIVGGRYGSIHPTERLSYTEMEYRYAISTGKPTLAFLHSDIDAIPAGRSERSTAGKSKLAEFRKLCQTRLCKMWNSPTDLGAKVSRSITQLIKREPAVGWIRGDQGAGVLRLELAESRLEIERLKALLKTQAVASAENLAQGADTFKIGFAIELAERKIGKTGRPYWVQAGEREYNLEISWDELLTLLGPDLLTSIDENRICRILNQDAKHQVESGDALGEDSKINNVKIYTESLKQIRLQLSALGLIEVDSGNPHGFSWNLSERGLAKVYSLASVKAPSESALHKESSSSPV